MKIIERAKLDTYLLRCSCFCQQGLIPKGVKDWERACQLTEYTVDSYLLRVRKYIYTMMGETGSVMDLFLDHFVPLGADCYTRLHQDAFDVFLALDRNDRTAAIRSLDQIIKEFPKDEEIPAIFYLFRALCYKNVKPYNEKNIDFALKELHLLRHRCDLYGEICITVIINICIQAGRLEKAKKYIHVVRKSIDTRVAQHTIPRTNALKQSQLSLELIEGTFNLSCGEHDLVENSLSRAVNLSEDLYAKFRNDLAKATKNYKQSISNLTTDDSFYKKELFDKWNCFLDVLLIHLEGYRSRYLAHLRMKEFKRYFFIADEKELSVNDLHRSFATLVETSRSHGELHTVYINDFCSSFMTYFDFAYEYLSALTFSILHHVSRGTIEKSRHYIEIANKLDDEHLVLNIAQGTDSFMRGCVDKAEYYFNKAVVAVHPYQGHEANAYVERANFYIQTFNFAQAEKDLRTAERMAPGLSIIYTEWGRLLFKQGKHKEAEAKFKLSLDINAHDVKAYTTRASCYMEDHFLDLAYDDLVKAKALNCKEFSYLYYVSLLCIRCGDYEKARNYADKARLANPVDCRSYILDAFICYLEKEYDESFEHLKTAEKKNSADSRIFVMYCLLSKHLNSAQFKQHVRKRKQEVTKKKEEGRKRYRINDIFLRYLISDKSSREVHPRRLIRLAKVVYLASPHKFLMAKVIADYLCDMNQYHLAFLYYTRAIQLYPYDNAYYEGQRKAYEKFEIESIERLRRLGAEERIKIENKVNLRLEKLKRRLAGDNACKAKAHAKLEEIKRNCANF